MKKAILFLGILGPLFLALQSYSQKNLSPGYVVHFNGDTTRGLIQYKRWARNPKTITFLSHPDGEKLTYGPGTIRAFFVATEHYESAVVDVDISPDKAHLLDEDRDPKFIRSTVFLQSLFRGEKRLLYLKDESTKVHFYIDDNGYRPLVFKKYKRNVESLGSTTKVIDENQEYKRQLFFYLNDCPSIQERIENTRYESSALTKLFSEYHSCIHKPASYSNERKLFEIDKGFLFGASGTSIHFNAESPYFYYITESVFTSSVMPSLGVFLEAKFMRSSGIIICNDIFLTSFDIRGHGTSRSGSELESRFQYHYLKMHNLVRIDLVRNGKLYIAAGPSSGALFKRKNHIKIVDPQGNETNQVFASRNYEFGAVGSLGLNLGRIGADLRYERSVGFSRYALLSATGNRIYLFIKYRLRKS